MAIRDIGGRERPSGADRDLAARVAAGDRVAADTMARRLFPVVCRIARSYLGGHADVDDAAQLALVEVLQAAENFEERGSLEGWAYRIAVRSIGRQSRRTRKHTPQSLVETVHRRPLELVGGDPPRVDESLPRPLHAYLGQLRDVQREAFVLRYALGHTIPEIAALTETPIPTVKSRIEKAQRELRRMIRRDLATHAAAPKWRAG